jgi:hypothetical protein
MGIKPAVIRFMAPGWISGYCPRCRPVRDATIEQIAAVTTDMKMRADITRAGHEPPVPK